MTLRGIVTTSLSFFLLSTSIARESEPAGKSAADKVETGQLVGILADSRGQKVYGGVAAVFLCDAESGMPIDRETKKPFNPIMATNEKGLGINRIWYEETDKDASFRFDNVPVGSYRLVAQSWSGTKGFPGFGANRTPSAILILHGVADNVEVKAGEGNFAAVRQLGNRALHITTDPEEEHNFLLFSLNPTLGDGILGPFGWGKEFRRHIIGITQMEVGYVTVMGLPEDASVHVGLANYDNSFGLGAASFKPGQREGTIRIIANWSNGHKDPPQELVQLTDHLEKEKIGLDAFLDEKTIAEFKHLFKDGDDIQRALYRVLMEDNDREVEVPGLGKRRLADVLAAYSYADIRKSEAKKKARRATKDNAADVPNDQL